MQYTPSLSDLPDPIIKEIFEELSTKELALCGCVCKRFKNIIETSNLWTQSRIEVKQRYLEKRKRRNKYREKEELKRKHHKERLRVIKCCHTPTHDLVQTLLVMSSIILIPLNLDGVIQVTWIIIMGPLFLFWAMTFFRAKSYVNIVSTYSSLEQNDFLGDLAYIMSYDALIEGIGPAHFLQMFSGVLCVSVAITILILDVLKSLAGITIPLIFVGIMSLIGGFTECGRDPYLCTKRPSCSRGSTMFSFMTFLTALTFVIYFLLIGMRESGLITTSWFLIGTPVWSVYPPN